MWRSTALCRSRRRAGQSRVSSVDPGPVKPPRASLSYHLAQAEARPLTAEYYVIRHVMNLDAGNT